MTGGGESQLGLLVSGRFAELEDALCERVAELKAGHPLAPLTVVVGSAAVRTRVGDLLVQCLGAVANVGILTLDMLARDLAATEGGPSCGALPVLVRERLVRRLLANQADELRYFSPVLERPHFAAALAATFADLRQGSVAPDSAWAEAVAASDTASGAGARARAADLDRLYRLYCDELARHGLVDAAGLYEAAARVVRAGGGGRRGHITLHGLYDLNQVQEALVAALVARGADVLAPLPRGSARDALSILGPCRAAGMVERHLDAGTGAQPDRCRVAAVWRPAQGLPADRLRFSGDDSLLVLSVSDERAQTREAVRAVIAAAAGGTRFRECAVVVPRSDDRERVAAALRAAGVPAACRLPDRSAGPQSLLRIVECLAPEAGAPFARRAVVDLLSGSLPAAAASVQVVGLWLDEARRAGVVGGMAEWTERVARRARGLTRRVAELEARGAAEADGDDDTAERLETVRLRLEAARGLEAAVGVLSRACAGLPARASWAGWAEAFRAAAAVLFEAGTAAAVGDVAGRLLSLAVLDEEVGLREAAGVLRESIAGAHLQVGRAGREGVAVLTPLELRGLSFSTIVFTGLAEGGYPVRGRPDPILGDADRRRVAESLGVRLPLAEQRDAESLLVFGLVCEAARERLVLCAPRTDAGTGRPRLPSRLLLRLATLAEGRAVGQDELLTGRPLVRVWRHAAGAEGVWVDRREFDAAGLLALSEGGGRTAVREYLAEVLGGVAPADRRLAAWRAARSPEPGEWDGLLGARGRAAIAARHPFSAEMHPTRLERYIACPFAFLLRDVLGLDPPDEPGDALEIDPLEFGTLAHDILQQAYEAVVADDLGLDAALLAVEDAWRSCCREAERRGVTGAALAWEVRRDMLLDDLLESVRRDPVFAHGDGRPVGAEWRFGEAAGRPVSLELDDARRVRFAGRIDRVDATPAGLRVIDYKTGAGRAERVLLKESLSVQLPVYQLAVRQATDLAGAEAGRDAVISALYRLVTRRGGFADLALELDETAATERLRELTAEVFRLVDAGLFPRTSRSRCDWCDVGYACGASAWSRARKRGDEALAAVVALQKPGARGDGHGD